LPCGVPQTASFSSGLRYSGFAGRLM